MSSLFQPIVSQDELLPSRLGSPLDLGSRLFSLLTNVYSETGIGSFEHPTAPQFSARDIVVHEILSRLIL